MPPSADPARRPTAAEAVVTLVAGSSTLAVAPAAGGAIACYRTEAAGGAIDWLRPATPAAIAAGQSDVMGCFPLVPFSNRVRDGRFRFRGRAVAMPANVPGQAHVEHGHGWQRPWRVVAKEPRMLAIEYTHQADAWPFTYRARQTFRLAEDMLDVTIGLRNLGDAPMPVGLGLHPYFPRTATTRLTAAVQRMWATDHEVMPTALVDLPAERRLDDGVAVDRVAMDNAFTGWAGRATIEWPDSGAVLTMTAAAPLSFLVVYTPPGEAYFCVEPVSNCTDAFNLAESGRDDTGTIVLAPGASLHTNVRFAIKINRN